MAMCDSRQSTNMFVARDASWPQVLLPQGICWAACRSGLLGLPGRWWLQPVGTSSEVTLTNTHTHPLTPVFGREGHCTVVAVVSLVLLCHARLHCPAPDHTLFLSTLRSSLFPISVAPFKPAMEPKCSLYRVVPSDKSGATLFRADRLSFAEVQNVESAQRLICVGIMSWATKRRYSSALNPKVSQDASWL